MKFVKSCPQFDVQIIKEGAIYSLHGNAMLVPVTEAE